MTQSAVRRVVIVGASAAGMSVASGLRAGGYDQEIRIIGDETETPYDRPPLTKQVLAGQWPPERAQLLSDARLNALDVTLELGRRAVALDTAVRRVLTDDDVEHAYDALVVATGIRPRLLPGSELTGIHVLRTLNQALSFKQAVASSRRLVIVGGGFLGLEAAASARGLGAEVTVVEPLARPLANQLGHRTAAKLIDLHEQHGVRVIAGVGVADWVVGRSGVRGVKLDDGRILDADVVLLAIGCTPCTEWLAGSGLRIENGVVCDEYCRAAPGVWAAGDVARWLHVGLGREIRLEHRTNASDQGNAVAQGILGAHTPFDPVPFFWTDHYDVKIQVAGILPAPATPEVSSQTSDGRFVELFHEGDSLSSVVGWNSPRQVVEHRRELDLRRPSRAGLTALIRP